MMQRNVSNIYLFIYLSIYLFNICLFDWFYLTNKSGFRIFSNTFRSVSSPIDNVFLVDADWLNALRRFPIS